MPEDGYMQFKSTEDWRRENKIEDLYETIDVDEYEAARKLVSVSHTPSSAQRY